MRLAWAERGRSRYRGAGAPGPNTAHGTYRGALPPAASTNLRNMVLPLSDVRPTWQDSKTDLTELIYLLDSKGCFGNVPLTQLASYISNAFNVHLDMNLSRTFCDMKIRNNPTPWLEKAKEALLKRMQTWKRNKKNGNSE